MPARGGWSFGNPGHRLHHESLARQLSIFEKYRDSNDGPGANFFFLEVGQ
jgi:hypothetical protein